MKKRIGPHWLQTYIFKFPQQDDDLSYELMKILEKYKLTHIMGEIDAVETDGIHVSGLRLKLVKISGIEFKSFETEERKESYVSGASNIIEYCNNLSYVTATFLDKENISTLHAHEGDPIAAVGIFDFRKVGGVDNHYNYYIWEYWNLKTNLIVQFGYHNTPEKISSDLDEMYN